jgi:IPT/TIG domain
MQIRGWFVGAIVGTLVVLALAPTVAQAAGVPTITSITPNQCGSVGGCKVIIRGTGFEEVRVVHVGISPLTITTGIPTRGKCKVKSSTELECVVGFHEHGVVDVEMMNAVGTSNGVPFTFLPDVYRNEVGIGAAHIPFVAYGQLDLEAPQINTTIECVNLGFGSAWNESQIGHGEILEWWASGHRPLAEHTELSSRCRFIYHGTEENQPTSPMVWVTAEEPLKLVDQEGVVCTEASQQELDACPNENERIRETVVREVAREGLSLPWNVQFTEREGQPRAQIGLPSEACTVFGGELSCENKSPIGCDIPPTPDPPGCVKLQILSSPPLNVHMEYEGYVEPLVLNGGPNGLSPSNLEFEGHARQEPGLHLREAPSTEVSTTGDVKILGYSGQELFTVK